MHVVVLDELGGILPHSLAPLDQRPCGSVRRSGPLLAHAHFFTDPLPQETRDLLGGGIPDRKQVGGGKLEAGALDVRPACPVHQSHRDAHPTSHPLDAARDQASDLKRTGDAVSRNIGVPIGGHAVAGDDVQGPDS